MYTAGLYVGYTVVFVIFFIIAFKILFYARYLPTPPLQEILNLMRCSDFEMIEELESSDSPEKDFGAHYAGKGLSILYHKNVLEDGAIAESLDFNAHEWPGWYSLSFVDQELEDLIKNGFHIKPDAQENYWANWIIGEMQSIVRH